MINNRDWWLDGLARLRKLLTKPWSRRIGLSDPVSFLLAHCADRAVTAKRQAEREECQSLGRFVEAALVGVVEKTKIMASVDNFFDYVVERLMDVQSINDRPVEKSEIELWWIDGLAKVKAVLADHIKRSPGPINRSLSLAHFTSFCEKLPTPERDAAMAFVAMALSKFSDAAKVSQLRSMALFIKHVEYKIEVMQQHSAGLGHEVVDCMLCPSNGGMK